MGGAMVANKPFPHNLARVRTLHGNRSVVSRGRRKHLARNGTNVGKLLRNSNVVAKAQQLHGRGATDAGKSSRTRRVASKGRLKRVAPNETSAGKSSINRRVGSMGHRKRFPLNGTMSGKT